ncbi:hypothetical protein J6590_054056 [Homalodisca vitripennis]|nr:hypothetical protein J6590_054056 [Homalodisca vitripennis]
MNECYIFKHCHTATADVLVKLGVPNGVLECLMCFDERSSRVFAMAVAWAVDLRRGNKSYTSGALALPEVVCVEMTTQR